MNDAEVVRTVVSWTLGFVVLLTAGVGIPLFASLIPDAIAHWRRYGERKPLTGLAALVTGLFVLAVFESTYTGAPGSPSAVVWGSLTLLLAAGTSCATGALTVNRALHRRARQRDAIAAVMQPTRDLPATNDGNARTKPAPVERMNARQAEHLACAWMQYLGAPDAIVTPEQRDGGVDVRSRDFLAQVKHIRTEPIGVAAIRQLHGVAAAEGRRAIFFSTSGYTRDATAFARDVHMALFIVRAHEGRLVPHGTFAQQYWLHSLTPTPQH